MNRLKYIAAIVILTLIAELAFVFVVLLVLKLVKFAAV